MEVAIFARAERRAEDAVHEVLRIERRLAVSLGNTPSAGSTPPSASARARRGRVGLLGWPRPHVRLHGDAARRRGWGRRLPGGQAERLARIVAGYWSVSPWRPSRRRTGLRNPRAPEHVGACDAVLRARRPLASARRSGGTLVNGTGGIGRAIRAPRARAPWSRSAWRACSSSAGRVPPSMVGAGHRRREFPSGLPTVSVGREATQSIGPLSARNTIAAATSTWTSKPTSQARRSGETMARRRCYWTGLVALAETPRGFPLVEERAASGRGWRAVVGRLGCQTIAWRIMARFLPR